MMDITIPAGVISIALGVVILAWPKSLNYVIAAWLIISGLLRILA